MNKSADKLENVTPITVQPTVKKEMTQSSKLQSEDKGDQHVFEPSSITVEDATPSLPHHNLETKSILTLGCVVKAESTSDNDIEDDDGRKNKRGKFTKNHLPAIRLKEEMKEIGRAMYVENLHDESKSCYYQCATCNRAFQLEAELISHKRTEHMQPSSIGSNSSNTTQDASFKGSQKSSQKSTSCGDKPCKYTCTVCSEKFVKKAELLKHMKVHTGQSMFPCSDCSATFSSRWKLNIHMRRHTGMTIFECSICSSEFAWKGALEAHMKVHTGDKPFECSVCNKEFALEQNMKRHMRTHTGEKPFECSVCSKRFADTGILNKHMRIHTGEKPFRCTVCDMNFSQKANLDSHMKKKHLEAGTAETVSLD